MVDPSLRRLQLLPPIVLRAALLPPPSVTILLRPAPLPRPPGLTISLQCNERGYTLGSCNVTHLTPPLLLRLVPPLRSCLKPPAILFRRPSVPAFS